MSVFDKEKEICIQERQTFKRSGLEAILFSGEVTLLRNPFR